MYVSKTGSVKRAVELGLTAVVGIKLLDERLSAPQRRDQTRAWASVNALVNDGIRIVSELAQFHLFDTRSLFLLR